MDTTWFAVDREGNVGVFPSGELGVVPLDLPDDETGAVEQALARHFRVGEWAYHPGGAEAPGWVHYPHFQGEPFDDVVMFLRDLEVVADDLQIGNARAVPSTQGVAVIWHSLSRRRLVELHTAGDCLHCRQEWSGAVGQPEPSRGSLFHFEHLTEPWEQGPYALETQPTRPLNVSELPTELAGEIARYRFENLSFRDVSIIDLEAHFPCRAWGGPLPPRGDPSSG
jgi:hypothetical protein